MTLAPPPARTILIVNDEPALLATVADLCEALGYRARQAQDLATALAHLAAGIDLLITDVQLRGVDSLELLRRIRAAAPGLPVIVMTGLAEAPELEALRALGIVGQLGKPFTPDELKTLLDRAWEAGSLPPSP